MGLGYCTDAAVAPAAKMRARSVVMRLVGIGMAGRIVWLLL